MSSRYSIRVTTVVRPETKESGSLPTTGRNVIPRMREENLGNDREPEKKDPVSRRYRLPAGIGMGSLGGVYLGDRKA